MAQRRPIEYVQFYTIGTAAQKVEVAKPKLAEPVFLPPVIRKRKKVFVDPVAIFGSTPPPPRFYMTINCFKPYYSFGKSPQEHRL